MVLPLSQVYLSMTDAFKTDCNNLIKCFKEKETADFREFVPVWKDFKFTLIYEKYAKYGHTFDFKEDSLQIAKVIMLNDHFVGGLYLIYGLYYLQLDPKPAIRLQLEEFEKILECVKEERNTLVETCMPGYIFAKMLKHNAFTFVRFAREYSMEGLNRSRMIHSTTLTLSTLNLKDHRTLEPKTWLRNFLKKFDFVDSLKKVEEEYYNTKKKLKEDYPDLNLALDIAPDDTIKCIENDLMEIATPAQKESTTPIGNRRRHLKARKMKIRRRYTKASEEDEAGPSTEPQVTVKKPKGRKKGHSLKYLNRTINQPTDDEDSPDSEPEGLKSSLPEI